MSETSVLVELKWALLTKESTITKTASYPSFIIGRTTISSMDMSDHPHDGTSVGRKSIWLLLSSLCPLALIATSDLVHGVCDHSSPIVMSLHEQNRAVSSPVVQHMEEHVLVQ